jgi:phenylacetic acid degradation operon negative regulatory protein
MSDGAMRPRSGSSATALLLTALGEFVLPRRGSVWTSTLVRSLGLLGVEERNARQALARLADQSIVRSHKEGRRARWQLTDHGRELLAAGAKRIYGFGSGNDAWDGRWLVVLCSVPEDQRAKRHQLRSQLGFAGFGFLAPSVALSPHLDRETVANAVLEELGLLPGAMVFRAEAGELLSAEQLLERGWDLAGLATRYSQFVRSFGRRSPRSDEARFVALTELVHGWRHFPFIDPEIPTRLLPRRWPGRRAKALFDERHTTWAPGANRWYEEIDQAAS